jgi:membrane protein implicated in regulation of membrane protease activity
MIEFLSHAIAWWHWIIIGIVVMVFEIVSFTFIFLAFGIAFIFVGIIDFFFVTSINTELIIWISLSVSFIAIWYLFFRTRLISAAGQSNNMLDTMGRVEEDIRAYEKGKVMFDIPVLGSKHWSASAKEDIPKGARIHIVEVKGQLLMVREVKAQEPLQN